MEKEFQCEVLFYNFWVERCRKYASKIRIASKNVSNKSCSELNFVQKSPRVHIFISPWNGATVLERLASSKYYSEGKQ